MGNLKLLTKILYGNTTSIDKDDTNTTNTKSKVKDKSKSIASVPSILPQPSSSSSVTKGFGHQSVSVLQERDIAHAKSLIDLINFLIKLIESLKGTIQTYTTDTKIIWRYGNSLFFALNLCNQRCIKYYNILMNAYNDTTGTGTSTSSSHDIWFYQSQYISSIKRYQLLYERVSKQLRILIKVC